MAEMDADRTVPARLEALAELAGARLVALGALLVALQPVVAMLQLGPAGTSGFGLLLMHVILCRASRICLSGTPGNHAFLPRTCKACLTGAGARGGVAGARVAAV